MQVLEFARKKLRCGMGLLCVASFVACGSQNDKNVGTKVPESNGTNGSANIRTLTRGLLGEPSTLDPQLADDTYSLQVIRDLYEGLTAEDQSGRVVPGVAKSWAVDPTGTVYTFQLRPDAKWSDGFPTIASEFVEGLRHAVDPKTASGSAALLTIIKGASDIIAGRTDVSKLGVVAIGNSVVQIALIHPAPFVLEILSQPIAAPLHANTATAVSNDAARDRKAATNGPYLLTNRVPNSFIDLARNPRYWNVTSVAIERVRYINSESETTELREYTAGQLDMTFTIPLPDLQRISQQYPSEVQVEPYLATLYLALNLSEPPMRSSRQLRQALSMAVDRELITSRVMMGVTPAYALVAKGITGYVSPGYAWSALSRAQQLAEARLLYASAGYSAKNPLHLKLYFNRDEGIHRLMVAIAGSWKQNLGVECELISDEFRVFLVGRKDKSRWDVARLGWTADYNDASSFLDVFSHDNTQDDTGYVSAAFNDTIDKAEMEPRNQERAGLFQKAELILLDDYPIIPIYFYKARRLVKPYVGGAQLTPMNRTYSKHLFWKSPP